MMTQVFRDKQNINFDVAKTSEYASLAGYFPNPCSYHSGTPKEKLSKEWPLFP